MMSTLRRVAGLCGLGLAVTSIGWTPSAALAQDVITQWRFNTATQPTNPLPSTGSGFAQTVGGTTGSSNGGSPNDSPSGSPATNQAWNIVGFPGQGVGSGTAGVEFSVSTVGFTGIIVSYDLRASNTATRWTQFQYSTDGTTFTNFGGPLEHTAGGDSWMSRTFDLSGIALANNNPNFKVRVLQVFSPVEFQNGVGGPIFAPNTGYQAAQLTSTYPGTSALRWDLVTVRGNAGALSPVSVTATSSPSAVCDTVGGPIQITALVTAGLNPTSTFTAPTSGVTIDLSSIGGPSSAALTTSDNQTWTIDYTVPTGVTPGLKSLAVSVRDDQNREATASALLGVADCAFSSNSPVVISQVYGNGSNAGPPPATFNADYIEIYNRSNGPVNLDGWSVQYAAATTSAGFSIPEDTVELSGIIQPGQYRLIRFSQPGPNGSPIPPPDFVRTASGGGISNTAGRVALVNTTDLVGQACGSPTIVDLVGWGNAVCFTGFAAASQTTGDVALIRAGNGAQDSRQNFHDFSLDAPNPRNRASAGQLAGFPTLSAQVICAGESVLLSVDVAAGASPPSTGIEVRADLSALGGSASQLLNGSGAGLWTLNLNLSPSTPQSVYTIDITVTDAQSRTDQTSATLAVAQCVPSNAPVVIAGFFGGGGNAPNTVNADYVELLNRTDQLVNLNGWSLQYAGPNTTGGFQDVVALTGSIQPGGYYLVQMGSAGSQGAFLPTPDLVASPAVQMNNTSGRLALSRTTLPVANNFFGPDVVDFVGYGPAISFAGVAPAPRLGNATLALRLNDGCTDRRQNALDFEAVDASIFPRNSASPTVTCPPIGPTRCNDADIAQTDSTPGPDGCVDNGDFGLFISSFFSAECSATCGVLPVSRCGDADIAQTDSSPGFDGCVDNGDFGLFISSFFSANCAATCNP